MPSWNPTRVCAPRSPGVADAESHATGDPNQPRRFPTWVNSIPPSAVATPTLFDRNRAGNTTSPPEPNRSLNSFAAVGVFTSHNTSNPAERTSTDTSTPSNTSGYSAVDPSRTGVGKVTPSRPRATSVGPPSSKTTTSCAPVPSTTSTGIATGDTDPSAAATRVVSISRHPSEPASSRNRTGANAVSSTTVPSASTNTCDVSERSDNTSTRTPDARAVTDAETQSGRTTTSAAGGVSSGSSARAGDATPNPVINATDTANHNPRTNEPATATLPQPRRGNAPTTPHPQRERQP